MTAVASRSLADIQETTQASLMNKSNFFQRKKERNLINPKLLNSRVFFTEIGAMHSEIEVSANDTWYAAFESDQNYIYYNYINNAAMMPWNTAKWMSERSKVRSIVGSHNIQF